MTQLFIRTGSDRPWLEAALPSDFRFKLTVDNTFFTRSGEYSGEIELPLSGCSDNLRIFGHVNRLDVSRRAVVFDARLVVDNRPMVVGSVTVLECNEQMVKVQLLGGNAAVNFVNRYNSTYIDQLDLGTVFDGLDISVNYESGGSMQSLAATDLGTLAKYLAIRAARFNAGTRDDSRFGTPANGFVIHPAVDESGCEVNSQAYIAWRLGSSPSDGVDESNRLVTYPGFVAHFLWAGSPPTCDVMTITDFHAATDHHDTPNTLQYRLCPQPYVDTVLRRVIESLGYSVAEDAIATGDFARCYIPSTTETALINEMLPHWLVTDFFSEVESFFGVIIYFDEAKKVCRILAKKDYFAVRTPAHLKMVDDRFETTFDEDNMVDASNANVSFGVDDDLHHIADDIVARAIAENYDAHTEAEMLSSLSGLTTIFGHDSRAVIASRAGRHYIRFSRGPGECDELRDYRISEDSSSKIELKLRPAKMATTKIRIIVEGYNLCEAWHEWEGAYGSMRPMLYPSPVCPVYGAFSNDISVADAVINGTQTAEKPDYLPLAIDNDYVDHIFKVEMTYLGIAERTISWHACWGSTYGREDVSDMSLGEPTTVLRLNPVEGLTTLYDRAIDIGLRIVGQTLTTVKIYDHMIPSLDRFFIFNGKKYCCQKIEYTVTNEGFAREKTGYFYAVDES